MTKAKLQKQTHAALLSAIKKAGSQSALAGLVGKTQGHVSKWVERKYVPAEIVLKIERATGVPRYLLRGDIYPNEATNEAH